MTKLTETQTTILRNAAEREDRNVLPLPGWCWQKNSNQSQLRQ